MDETRIMLEETNEKNGLLERKFRKVDSELMEVIFRHKQIIDYLHFQTDPTRDFERSQYKISPRKRHGCFASRKSQTYR